MKLRIAHTSDNHWREEALDECERVHAAFVDQIRDRGVQVVLLGGDFFERRSTPAERNACARWLRDLVAAKLYVFGVAGNHDSPGDLELFNDVLGVRGRILDRDLKLAAPRVIDRLSGFTYVGLPWVERTQFATQGLTVRSLMDEVADLGRRARAADFVPILVAHVEIEGYATPAGVMPAGSTHAIPPNDPGFAPFAYVACGHIHGKQTWADGRVAYCGSPTRSNYGEAAEEKGWLLVEVDSDAPEGTAPKIEFVPLPARRMHTLDYIPDIVPEGDAVRVRLAVTAEEAAATDVAAIEQRLRDAGAADVRVEIVVAAEARVRSEEITAAGSTWEQVLAFFRAKGGLPDEARLGRLRDELARIEQEVAHVGA